MRDYLLDLVEHTYDLGCVDLVKIVGTDKDTAVEGLAEDKSVVLKARFATPVAEFMGTFGMPNLNKLKILLKARSINMLEIIMSELVTESGNKKMNRQK